MTLFAGRDGTPAGTGHFGQRASPATYGRETFRVGSVAWLGVALVLAAVALTGSRWPASALDWQPERAFVEPWRALSAVGVHYGSRHLVGNLAGLGLTAVLGAVARLPARFALAWLLAWPATQFGLLERPELQHFGGLSGVLHAGVAVVAAALACSPDRRQRLVGLAIFAGLVAKVAFEAPWGPALRRLPGEDLLVAPFAHLTGIGAGVLATAAVMTLAACSDRRRPPAADATGARRSTRSGRGRRPAPDPHD